MLLCSMSKVISETDKARAAGWVDGEGSIYLRRFMNRNGINPCYCLKVNVSNNDPRIIKWLSALWGGSTYTRLGAKSKYQHFAWSIECAQAGAFLKDIRPYLIIKQDQADLAIKFQDKRSAERGHTRGGVPSHLSQEREDIFRELQELKRKHWIPK